MPSIVLPITKENSAKSFYASVSAANLSLLPHGSPPATIICRTRQRTRGSANVTSAEHTSTKRRFSLLPLSFRLGILVEVAQLISIYPLETIIEEMLD